MATKDVKIRISEKGAAKTSRGLKKVDKSLVSMGKAAGVAAVAFFGVGKLIQGFKSAIDAAGKQELAEKKLATALGKTSDALLNQAKALQQVTMFGDEDIIMMQSMLAAFTDNEGEIEKLTVATLDLASGMGIDLKSAGDLLAKTIGSSTNALSRYGIEVNGAVGSTERLESLTGNIANLFGGQASAQAETMTGAIEQMKNAIGDAAEAFGGLLAPVVITVAKSVKLLAEGIGAVTGSFSGFMEDAERAAKDATILEGFKENTVAVEDFKKGLTELSDVGLTGLALEYEATAGSALLLTQEEKDRADKAKLIFEEHQAREKLKKQATEGTAKSQEFLNSLFIRGEEGLQITEQKEIDIAEMRAKFNADNKKAIDEANKLKEAQIVKDLKFSALSGQSAKDSAKSVIRAESMEAVAGLISSILKSVPFPFNTILAAGAGATAASLIDKGLSQFATGGDFVTSGPQMIMVGDNPGGKERVQVTPLGSPNVNGPQGGININFSGPITNDDYVRDFIIPEITKATRLNLA